MLDLNLVTEKLQEPAEGLFDDSGTSNSSIVNGEASINGGGEDESCSMHATEPSMFRFDILKKGYGDFVAVGEDEEGDDAVSIELQTRQLFPFEEVSGGFHSGASSSRPHWTDIDFCMADIGGQMAGKLAAQPPQGKRKSRRGPRSRSSQYRGVTFYRRTGRWESHIWDCGKQVYLGGFDTALAAARAYDRAAIKFRGFDADINFNLSDYVEDLKLMRNLNKEEFVQVLRRQSTGFSRGSSKYRGVALKKCGPWEARMGQFLGKKAYDRAAAQCSGADAVTNFEQSIYQGNSFSEAPSAGAMDSLDLNLGISPPSVAQSEKGQDELLSFHFSNNPVGFQRAKMGICASATSGQCHCLRVGHDHPFLWMVRHPACYSTNSKEASVMADLQPSSTPIPGWMLQLQDSPSLALPSAASSGFSTGPSARAALPPQRAGRIPPTLLKKRVDGISSGLCI